MSLFAKELWDLKYRVIIMLILISGIGITIISSYNLFVNTVDIFTIETLLKTSILSRFIDNQIIVDQLDKLKNNIDLYIWSQWFGKNLMQLLLLASILLGFSTFARETENSTFSFLLTNFSRSFVFLSKISAGIASLILLVAIGCLIPAIVASFRPFDFEINLAAKYFIQILPACLFVYAIIILFSVISKDVVKPIILGITTFALLSLTSYVKSLKIFYIYRYLSGADVFTFNEVNLIAFMLISLLTVLVFLVAQKLYSNKNF